MKHIVLFVVGALVFLPLGSLRAAPADPSTAKAVHLLQKIKAGVSTVPTYSLVTLDNLRDSPIEGRSLAEGIGTYYRYGYIVFHDRHGGGFDVMPEHDSLAVLHPDSLYLGMVIAPQTAVLASNRSFDLSPYLPGCRLYVYYRENLDGLADQSDMHETMTESRIYHRIRDNLQALGITNPSRTNSAVTTTAKP